MAVSRRRFMQWAASIPVIGGAGLVRDGLVRDGLKTVPYTPERQYQRDVGDGLQAVPNPRGYRPELLPSKQDIWDQQLWMAKLGPKYTGNKAHATFVGS